MQPSAAPSYAGPPTGSTPTQTNPQRNPIAAAWILAAQAKLRANDLAGAAQLLAQVRQLNDREPGLWGVQGDLDWKRGQVEQAINDYTREKALYPQNIVIHSKLAAVYLSQGNWSGTEQAERDWAKAAPADERPREALAYVLQMTGQYGESVAAYEEAIALSKKPDRLEVELGRAQIKSGQTAAGQATLRKLLSVSDDPAVLNGAAFGLSDAGLNLPEAELAAHKAVGILSDRSAAVRIETVNDDDLALMPQLAEAWDTLGWIYFKQHQLSEAEDYVQSAWLLGNHDEVGLHLGQIYEAEGKNGAAVVTYRMTAAQIPSLHPLPYYAQMKTDLLARAAALQPDGNPVILDTSAGVALRNYTIANPVNGSADTAEFVLRMTGNKADEVRFLRGDASLKAADKALKKVAYNASVPKISRARMIRLATVSCVPGAATCSLHLKGIFGARMER